MDSLIVKSYDLSLQSYEQAWIEKLHNNFHLRNEYRNPILSLYTSMVFGFANHLPYSMDIEQPEYVPADFLNFIPEDVDDNPWFKWNDRRTYFNALINWGDTFKTGMLLQICNIFQKMILGEFPNSFELTEKHFEDWGVEWMTPDQEYNRCFFETLKALPSWYKKLISSVNNTERRKILDEMYDDIMNKISARYGSFKETDEAGNIVKEYKGSIKIRPSSDVSMLVHWDDITYHDGIPDIVEAIKAEQFAKYKKRKEDTSLEEGYVPKLK